MTDRGHATGALEWCHYYITDELRPYDEADQEKMRATVIQLFEGNDSEVVDAARTIAEKAVDDRWQFARQKVCTIALPTHRPDNDTFTGRTDV